MSGLRRQGVLTRGTALAVLGVFLSTGVAAQHARGAAPAAVRIGYIAELSSLDRLPSTGLHRRRSPLMPGWWAPGKARKR